MSDARKARWREAMLGESSVGLKALAGNYLGAAASAVPDKARIVSGLAAMFSGKEVQDAAAAMMDRMDELIVGTLCVLGEADAAFLRSVLSGEASFYELDYRLANLCERLILFATKEGSYAVNPYFEPAARARAATAETLFGNPGSSGAAGEGEAARARGIASAGQPSAQDLGLAVYALLREDTGILLKSGQLSSRARKRLAAVCGDGPSSPEAAETIVAALSRAKIMDAEGEGITADFKAFADMLQRHDDDFAFKISCLLAGIPEDEVCGAVSESFAPYFEREFRFSKAGLGRFLRLLPGADLSGERAAGFIAAMSCLGLLAEEGDGLRCDSARAACRWRTTSNDVNAAVSVDGSGAIHVLPSASLEDLVALLDMGELARASGAWEIALTRKSLRRAFSTGKSAEDVEQILGGLSGRAVPQALDFDIRSWENEYNSIKLYRGYVLSADRNSAKIMDQSGFLSRFPHEVLGEGLYYFGAIQPSAIEEALADIGLPPPALRGSAKSAQGKRRQISPRAAPRPANVSNEEAPAKSAARQAVSLPAPRDGDAVRTIPSPERSLRTAIETMDIPAGLRKKLEERARRKLIYTEKQLRAMVEEEALARKSGRPQEAPESGLAAGGLDFNGKLRVIQAALKATFSRLDVKWTFEREIRTCSVRPVNLRKTEKDYVLEGEDLASSGPVSIRVGSIMQVSLRKGYLLGEE